MITLSNGFLLPEAGDKGSVWFPAIESNIQRMNDHSHNGTNSERLNSDSVVSLTATILPAAWAVQPSGIYRATVTMPGATLFDSKIIKLRANNKELYADIQKVTANTFYVFVNDNLLTVSVVYA